MPKVTQVKTFAEFQAAIEGNKVVVVDFFATWCGPCKMIAPKVEGFAGQYTNATFIKVDVDEVGDAASAHKITAMPTFKIFKDGKPVKDVVGADPNKLQAAIEEVLKQ